MIYIGLISIHIWFQLQFQDGDSFGIGEKRWSAVHITFNGNGTKFGLIGNNFLKSYEDLTKVLFYYVLVNW